MSLLNNPSTLDRGIGARVRHCRKKEAIRMRVKFLAPIEGNAFDEHLNVVFQGEPDDLGDGELGFLD